RTGSGKTAAFGLPMIHALRDGGRTVRALVLAPTRELARQVSSALEDFARHLPVKILTVYGGVGYRQQLSALKRGVSVVVGTPGRVLDHVRSGALSLSGLELLVLDEADEMLQMGFIDDIEAVLEASPGGRQIALFSATMPKAIQQVAQRYLDDPVRVQVEEQAMSSSHISQRWIKVAGYAKTDALVRVLRVIERDAALVFARTRADVARVAGELLEAGFSVDALHGDLSQAARETVMKKLRAKHVDVVVATDVAARGLDVDHITHVINYDLPENTEIYVHRIGRTARAGRDGVAISFVKSREIPRIKRIARKLDVEIGEYPVPNDIAIAQRQRQDLLTELDESMDAAGNDLAEALLEQILGETGWEPKDVAAAALSLLATERRFDLKRVLSEQSRRKAPEPEKPHPQTLSRRGEVELFFAAGRRDGLRAGDFVGALCNDGGLTGDDIGQITVGGRKTFVKMARETAAFLMRNRPILQIRGEDHPIQLSFSSVPEGKRQAPAASFERETKKRKKPRKTPKGRKPRTKRRNGKRNARKKG
ncbi:MAG: DEAD/DEAH box helicase, partial [Myxococcota bacterium]